MRYLFAIIFGLGGAGLAGKFIAPWVAPMVTSMFTYESPDGEAFVEQTTFIGVLLVALLLGWVIGMAVGRSLERPDEPI